MLISEAISAAAALTGQVVSNATLVRWLSELDGRLAFEFYRVDAWTPYDPTDDLSCELLVPFPWDGMYVHHLAAQTYFTNGEYDRYENERVMSEKTLADFRSFMQRTQSRLCGCGFPTEKSGGSGVIVIPGDECHGPWFWLSAYALAVKHGYKGTEDEWVDEQREYVDASLAAKNAAETARDLAYGYSGNAAERAAAAAISAGSASEAAINAATSATSASGSATSAANSVTAAAGYARNAEVSAAAAAASAAAAQVDASKASDVYLEFYGADDPDTTDPSEAANAVAVLPSKGHSVFCQVVLDNSENLYLMYAGADTEAPAALEMNWIHHFIRVFDGKLYDLTLTAPAMPVDAFTPYWGSLTVTEFAGLASPAFTGTPTAPTPTSGDDSTKLATTAFVSSAIGDRIFIVEYGAMNPTADYDKITAAIASGFAVLCRFRLDTTTPVYYYAPLTEKRKIGGKEWYVFESVLNNEQTEGWSNITGAALLQRRILKKIDNTCSWALETVALPCPTPPTNNGNYKLRLTKVSNGVTYSWVADT